MFDINFSFADLWSRLDAKLKTLFNLQDFVDPFVQRFYDMPFIIQVLAGLVIAIVVLLGVYSLIKKVVRIMSIPIKIGITIAVVAVIAGFIMPYFK